MSILSDGEIKQLCNKPNFKVRRQVKIQSGLGWNFVHEVKDEFLTDLSGLDINSKREDEGILYVQQIVDVKQMIEPFVSEQVRVRKETMEEYFARAERVRSKLPEGHPSKNIKGVELDGDMIGNTYFNFNNPNKIISYGLSGYGYDVRLDRKFKIFSNINSTVIDPLNFDHGSYVDFEGDEVIIPPNSYILGLTVETFCIPRDVMVICLGKSTYARAGAIVNVTPIEPGFEGKVVIEISNSTPLPLKVYANQGISQFVFFKGNKPCETSYSDKGGKYQGQNSIVTPIG